MAMRMAVGTAVVADDQSGPIRQTIIATGAAFQIYSQAERNNLTRIAIEAMGRKWIKDYMLLRFTGYALKLGYIERGSPSAVAWKERWSPDHDSRPNVLTGTARKMAADGATAKGRATAGNCSVTIKIPQPWYALREGKNNKQPVALFLMTIPPDEVQKISKTFAEIMSFNAEVAERMTEDKRQSVAAAAVIQKNREAARAARKGAAPKARR